MLLLLLLILLFISLYLCLKYRPSLLTITGIPLLSRSFRTLPCLLLLQSFPSARCVPATYHECKDVDPFSCFRHPALTCGIL